MLKTLKSILPVATFKLKIFPKAKKHLMKFLKMYKIMEY
jgi:hypothetical protein